jgi:dTDP-glucose 4,6-dehydratase
VRDWLHVSDHCQATDLVLRGGRPGEVYNIGGDSERTNLEVIRGILEQVHRRAGRPLDELLGLIRHVKDRPGHDRRYAIDAGKLKAELGFAPRVDFAQGLARTVDWYRTHAGWVSRVRSGEYRAYYERNYAGR